MICEEVKRLAKQVNFVAHKLYVFARSCDLYADMVCSVPVQFFVNDYINLVTLGLIKTSLII
jgi:hypothetical protein